MEASLYDQETKVLRNKSAAIPAPAGMNQKKKNLTLDLNPSPMKKMKFNPGGSGPSSIPSLLSSSNLMLQLGTPELEKLQLGTPELEKMLLGVGTNTPTPTLLFTRGGVTEEQEIYARGFEDALKTLHNNGTSNQHVELPASSSGSSTSGAPAVYTNLDQQNFGGFLPTDADIIIKDEPQTVPSASPPMSPIDMECQERIKLERKRQRNRVAASKCRKRKLERISRLEDKVKVLKGENSELSSVVNKLKEHVSQLKEQVMEHYHAGCQVVIAPQY